MRTRLDGWRRHVARSLAMWLSCLVWLAGPALSVEGQKENAGNGDMVVGKDLPLRVGVSARTMGDLNRADITAAMTVWIRNIATKQGISADPTPHLFERVEDLIRAIKEERIDILSAPADEFILIEKAVPLAGHYTTLANGSIFGTCIVLVRTDSPFQTLSALRGKRLVALENPSTSLARIWLDTQLWRDGLSASKDFFLKIDPVKKVNSAILPVFFSQADACLVTQTSFDMAGELNPQILKQLRVLVSSVPLISGMGSARAALDPSIRQEFRRGAFQLSDSVSGQHILNLFQCDAIVGVTEDDLASTRALLAEYERLKAEKAASITMPTEMGRHD